MATTGISRKVDGLGRIVIPIELRRNLNIETGDSLDINIENDKVVLTKRVSNNCCVICLQEKPKYNLKEKSICTECAKELAKFVQIVE